MEGMVGVGMEWECLERDWFCWRADGVKGGVGLGWRRGG